MEFNPNKSEYQRIILQESIRKFGQKKGTKYAFEQIKAIGSFENASWRKTIIKMNTWYKKRNIGKLEKHRYNQQ